MRAVLTLAALAAVLVLAGAAVADEKTDPVDGKTFQSVEKLEGGRGGAKINWTLTFKAGKFTWRYSDVSEAGTYEVDAKTNKVTGKTPGRDEKLKAEFDPKTGVLTWDGVKYQQQK
jgi:hypothetical protein